MIVGFAGLSIGIVLFLDLFELGKENIGTVLMTSGGVIIGIGSGALIASRSSNRQNPPARPRRVTRL